MKTCVCCNTQKQASEFKKYSTTKDGLSKRCRQCSAKWYSSMSNKSKKDILKKNEAYSEKNIEKIKEYRKAYYMANKDKINEYSKARYLKTKDKKELSRDGKALPSDSEMLEWLVKNVDWVADIFYVMHIEGKPEDEYPTIRQLIAAEMKMDIK